MAHHNTAPLPPLDAHGLNIAIVHSRFNPDICHGLLEACRAELAHLGARAVDVFAVPGALEIPVALQSLIERYPDHYHAAIALGAVIRGETYHFELVANESAAGITRVGLDYNCPIANGILTTEDEAQARARMVEKGKDCARAAVEMALFQRALARP